MIDWLISMFLLQSEHLQCVLDDVTNMYQSKGTQAHSGCVNVYICAHTRTAAWQLYASTLKSDILYP